MYNLGQELPYRKNVSLCLSNSEISRNVKEELVKTTQNISLYLRKLVYVLIHIKHESVSELLAISRMPDLSNFRKTVKFLLRVVQN
jgi:hypothetical protein